MISVTSYGREGAPFNKNRLLVEFDSGTKIYLSYNQPIGVVYAGRAIHNLYHVYTGRGCWSHYKMMKEHCERVLHVAMTEVNHAEYDTMVKSVAAMHSLEAFDGQATV